MKLAMKDLEVAAEKRMQITKMHDYKGFTIEPKTGGFNIAMYGIKNILYVAGNAGWRLTEDLQQARSFRDPKTCHDLIDEIITDWQGWIESFGGEKHIDYLTKQQQNIRENVGAVRQQGIVM